MTYIHKNDVQKMIDMSKAFPYQAYKVDYGLLEKQAKKLKVIKKPKQVSNCKTIRP